MDDLISVIIPVYNSQLYIEDCIKSIQTQSYPNMEILIVDDGSIDNSRVICEGFCKTDDRIQYFFQKHQGVSVARNTGIKEAKGKYLFFLDSDDMIHPDLLEALYRLLEEYGAMIATEDYCKKLKDIYSPVASGTIGEKSDRYPSEKNPKNYLPYTYLENQEILWEFLIQGIGGVGGKMIRYTALQSIRFDKNLIIGEDTKFIYQLIINGTDAVYLHRNWYFYRRHENKAVSRCTIKAIQSIYESVRYICDSEREYGRIKNAVWYESYIVTCILNWKILNRQVQDTEVKGYLNRIIENERKRDIFSMIDWYKKKDFYLMLYSYPLFCLNHKLSDVWRKKKNIETIKKTDKYTNGGEKLWRSKEKISVIIVMHSDKYIRRCVQSVSNQTYSNLEIIVVDDGTADRGIEICEKLQTLDDRIRILSQENRCVSEARNYGFDIATGKYVFCMDSEDTIHPLLLEELIWQLENKHAVMALCEYAKPHAIWKTGFDRLVEKEEGLLWEIVEGDKSEEWIYKKYYNSLNRVGILICRKAVGTLRFDESLICGSEILFIYQLICKQPRIVYTTKRWYYHRPDSEYSDRESNPQENIKPDQYFTIYRMLRDGEFERRHSGHALLWERRLIWLLRQEYMILRKEKYEEQSHLIRNQAIEERRHPLFKKLAVTAKILFYCCFFCYPIYSILNKPIILLDKLTWSMMYGEH